MQLDHLAQSVLPASPHPAVQDMRDGLTGLYSCAAMQYRVSCALNRPGGGALILLDLDDFKTVNDYSGHLAGDEILRGTALALSQLFWARDIIARTGEDVFCVYVASTSSAQMMADKTTQLRRRLRELGEAQGLARPLTASIGVAYREAEDDWDALFARAAFAMGEEKAARALALHARRRSARAGGGALCTAASRSVATDLTRIRREIRERGTVMGAYCQDYESFKRIYRFVERGLRRSGRTAFVLLMTLTDGEGNFTPLEVRCTQMQRLHEAIQASLRSGDVFAQYSSGQFLLMVLGATRENANVIGERVRRAFLRTCPPEEGASLRFDVYPIGHAEDKAAAGKAGL